jgi:hypothetical protein
MMGLITIIALICTQKMWCETNIHAFLWLSIAMVIMDLFELLRLIKFIVFGILFSFIVLNDKTFTLHSWNPFGFCYHLPLYKNALKAFIKGMEWLHSHFLELFLQDVSIFMYLQYQFDPYVHVNSPLANVQYFYIIIKKKQNKNMDDCSLATFGLCQKLLVMKGPSTKQQPYFLSALVPYMNATYHMQSLEKDFYLGAFNS